MNHVFIERQVSHKTEFKLYFSMRKNLKISLFITIRHKPEFTCTQSPTGNIFRILAGRNPHTVPTAECAVEQLTGGTSLSSCSDCAQHCYQNRGTEASACLPLHSHCDPLRAVIPHNHTTLLTGSVPQHPLSSRHPCPMVLVTGAQE